MSRDPTERAARLIRAYADRGLMIATAESCTGGLVTALLTEIPGSSAVVERGFITYSNEAKTELIGVPSDLIVAHGAVSEPVARAMADGALSHSRAHVAVAITGIGPSRMRSLFWNRSWPVAARRLRDRRSRRRALRRPGRSA
jgi:nicotinamide-nucleotide amidase